MEVHHCKGATFKHSKTLVGHWFCIPLTPDMHKEYHAGTRAFCKNYGPQSLLWEKVHDKYFSETGDRAPQEVIEAIRDYGR